MKYFAVILFLLNVRTINCKMVNHIKAYKVECSFSEAYVINGSCSLKPVNRHSSAFSLYAYLTKPIDSFMVTFNVFRRYNTFVPFPLNFRVSPCEYFSGQKKSFLFNTVKIFLDTYTNVNHSCPYSGAIIAKNVEFIPSALRNATSLIPQGIYRVDVHAFKDIEANSMALGRAYVEVKEQNDSM